MLHIEIEHRDNMMAGSDPYCLYTSTSMHGNTILIADDELSIRELLQDILEPVGAHVLLARSGSEALVSIETSQPDIAILDIRMPAPDGLAILRQLRTAGSTLPVVIITAHDVANLSKEVMQAGANAYITKPFDPDKVVAAVMRVLHYSRV